MEEDAQREGRGTKRGEKGVFGGVRKMFKYEKDFQKNFFVWRKSIIP